MYLPFRYVPFTYVFSSKGKEKWYISVKNKELSFHDDAAPIPIRKNCIGFILVCGFVCVLPKSLIDKSFVTIS